ncbi:MAG TPA: DUF2330 domain-containing protein, partial [Polyangiaceae bacterium]
TTPKASIAAGLLALLATTASLTLGVERAEACGGFFPATLLSERRRPSLAHEQALIIYDQKANRQHFIREVAFRRATEPFGFVVPTPSRPEVAAVTKSPFRDLRQVFGFGGVEATGGFGSFRPGTRGGGGIDGVTLLDVKNVGSFTAFVLAATDEIGLSNWLARQKLVKSPEAGAWLAHYVRLGFFFVAMRYEPKPEAAGTRLVEPDAAKSETMRISFDSALPYYPYFEPERPGVPDELRLLELWVASDGAFEPVSVLDRDGTRRWVRPFRAGDRHDRVQAKLASVLAPELWRLLPAGAVTVTTYQDQKASRRGFGDVLFVPARAPELTPARRSALEKLLPVLDPELVSEPNGSRAP